jgi:hypothetical protein
VRLTEGGGESWRSSVQSILERGVLLFLACLLVHIAIWRIFRPRNQVVGLVFIFAVIPVVLGVPGVLIAARFSDGGATFPGAAIQWGLAYILHLAASGSYMFLYTAVAGASPSIAILEKVDAHMPKGLKRSELAPAWFTDAALSGARKENLLATGLIADHSGALELTFRGRIIAMTFLLFRRFLGLPDVAKG